MQDVPLVEVVLRYRDSARGTDLRNLCTYAGQAIGSDDPSIEHIGHGILRTLGRVYASSRETFIKTKLIERASAQDGEKRERLVETATVLRSAHPDLKVWSDLDKVEASEA